MKASIQSWWRREGLPLTRDLMRDWRQDRVGGLGAEIAFFAVLGLFPAMLALAAALGSLDQVIGTELAQRSQRAVVSFLQQILTERAAGAIDATRELFEEESPGLISVATLGSVWVFSRGVLAAIRALDVAYDLPEQRSWIKTRLKALAIAVGTLAVLVLLLVIVVVGPLVGLGKLLAGLAGFEGPILDALLALRFPVAFALLIAWAMMVFRFGPNHHSPGRRELPGAVLTGVLWLGASLGFRLYLDLAPSANRVLGALGGALILMIWLYLLSLALLIGGELNAELNAELGARRGWVREAKEP